jgi:hypothetical protein
MRNLRAALYASAALAAVFVAALAVPQFFVHG